MPDILIRDVPPETKRRLEERAAQHGHSRNSELLDILEATLAPRQHTWVDILREAAEDSDDAEPDRPAGTTANGVATE